MPTHEDLRRIALAEFAASGYGGTSLQRVAELAGVSKSSVLYHFDSKEALLEAAIAPALDRMDQILATLAEAGFGPDAHARFLQEFVDFLLAHRLEVHTFINQSLALQDVPVVLRAHELVGRLSEHLQERTASTIDSMRFGVALGGAAYMLCSMSTFGVEEPPEAEVRAALLQILGELLAPIRIH